MKLEEARTLSESFGDIAVGVVLSYLLMQSGFWLFFMSLHLYLLFE